MPIGTLVYILGTVYPINLMILRYIFAHLLFFVTGVGVTVLLMNLLIGILSALMVRIGGALSGQLYQREILNFQEDDLGCPWVFSPFGVSFFGWSVFYMLGLWTVTFFYSTKKLFSYNPIPSP